MLLSAATAVNSPSGRNDTVLSRFHRLTPREARLLILGLEGRSHAELAATLGISQTSVANSMSRVRRKLGVGRGQKLSDFVSRAPDLANVLAPLHAAEADAGPEFTRRRKDVLRVTIAELEGFAAVVRRRATALEALRGDADDLVPSREEAAMVDRVADLIDDAIEQVLREARQERAEVLTTTSPVPS